MLYWCSPLGDDDNDGGTDAPWLTLTHAANTARPGDTVVFKDGPYPPIRHVNFRTWGTLEAPIILRPENPDQAIINFDGAVPESCITIEAGHIRLGALVFDANQRTASALIRIRGDEAPDGVVLSGCTLRNGNLYGVRVRQARNLTISGCTIDMNPSELGTAKDGISLSSCSRAHIARCRISRVDHTGVRVGSNNVEDVVIEHCAIHGTGSHGFGLTGGDSITVRHCVFRGLPGWDKYESGMGMGFYLVNGSNLLIHHNIAENIGYRFVEINGCNQVRVLNNTAYRCCLESKSRDGAELLVENLRPGAGVKFKNNAIQHVSDRADMLHVPRDQEVDGLDLGHNCYHSVPGASRRFYYQNPYDGLTAYQHATKQEQGSIDANPLFAAPDHHDFRLQSDSPCAHAGVNVGLEERKPHIGACDVLLKPGIPELPPGTWRVSNAIIEVRDE